MQYIYKPPAGFPVFYQQYMDRVPDDGLLLQHLQDIMVEFNSFISALPEEKLLYRYDAGKWTIKDILLHLCDCERVIVYRAMRIARADKTPMPGFDENLFVESAGANTREVGSMLRELMLLRTATIFFIETLDEAALDRTGTANGFTISTRLLVNHLYGHHRHHLEIIKERYLS
jgi:DNA-dependent RNA polymerase auxiliary subunit epsilon